MVMHTSKMVKYSVTCKCKGTVNFYTPPETANEEGIVVKCRNCKRSLLAKKNDANN